MFFNLSKIAQRDYTYMEYRTQSCAFVQKHVC